MLTPIPAWDHWHSFKNTLPTTTRQLDNTGKQMVCLGFIYSPFSSLYSPPFLPDSSHDQAGTHCNYLALSTKAATDSYEEWNIKERRCLHSHCTYPHWRHSGDLRAPLPTQHPPPDTVQYIHRSQKRSQHRSLCIILHIPLVVALYSGPRWSFNKQRLL